MQVEGLLMRRLDVPVLAVAGRTLTAAERLAALRAGRPVNIPASDLPPWVRDGRAFHWTDRAVVSADGAVRFEVDDGRLWCAENGL